MSSEESVECCEVPFPPGTDDFNIDDNMDSVPPHPEFELLLASPLESSIPINDKPVAPTPPGFILLDPVFGPTKFPGGGTE